MDRLDAETWCDECGELGWEGVCPACVAFDERLRATAEAA
jgi:hypothetical protein